jgi:hypothetical protein
LQSPVSYFSKEADERKSYCGGLSVDGQTEHSQESLSPSLASEVWRAAEGNEALQPRFHDGEVTN